MIVRLSRITFILYAGLCLMGLWDNVSVSSLTFFCSFAVCSLVGLGFSFYRTCLSRYVLAVLVPAIPAVYLALECLFDRPVLWELGFVVLIWLAVPVLLAISLFADKETSTYFTRHVV